MNKFYVAIFTWCMGWMNTYMFIDKFQILQRFSSIPGFFLCAWCPDHFRCTTNVILISIFSSQSPLGKFFNNNSLIYVHTIKFVGVGSQLLNCGWYPLHLPRLSHLPLNYLTMSQHSSLLADEREDANGKSQEM